MRTYLPDRVDQASIHALLASAVSAPTARHEEPWAFTVVQDAKLLKRISDRAKELLAVEAHRGNKLLAKPGLDRFTDPTGFLVDGRDLAVRLPFTPTYLPGTRIAVDVVPADRHK